MNRSPLRPAPSRPAGGLAYVVRIVIAVSLALVAAVLGGNPTRGEGLSFTTYTTANGLASNGIWGVYANGSSIYVGTSMGVSISLNSGATWTNYSTANGLNANGVTSVVVDGSTIYAANYWGGLRYSTNGGANWTQAKFVNDPAIEVYAKNNSLYLANVSSVDVKPGGGSWNSYSFYNGLPQANNNGIHASGNSIYVATNDGLSISPNGGASWTNYRTTEGLAGNTVLDVFTDSGKIYAATSGGLSVSADAGTSWTNYLASEGVVFFGVYANGPKIYAASGYGLYVSSNSGTSWTHYLPEDGLPDYALYDVFGDGDKVYVGSPSGLTVISPVPEPTTYAMALAGLACGGFSMWRRRKRA